MQLNIRLPNIPRMKRSTIYHAIAQHIFSWTSRSMANLRLQSLFYVLLSFLATISCNGPQNQPTIELQESTPSSFAPPQVTLMANLSDSLQPKTTLLKNVPAPLVVPIPTKSGGTYPSKNSLNEIIQIKLQAPIKKSLEDVNGIAPKDSTGRPILGLGGKSDFTTFTTDNGLALDGISCSFSDRLGNLWFGTLGAGASKYDGKSFTTFSLAQGMSNVQISDIIQDRTGNIWFATRLGVSKYDGYSFTTITTAQGLIHNVVNKILEDKNGNIWMTTGVGITKYDPIKSSSTNYTTTNGLSHNVTRGIVEDEDGKIWITTRTGLCRYDPAALPKDDGKIFTSYTTTQGLIDNNVGAMLKDKAGYIWIASSVGVSKIEPKIYTGEKNSTTGKIEGITNYNDPLWVADISTLVEDQTGKIWIGKFSEGISVFDPVKNNFTNITTTQGLASNEVNTITEDKNGNIWIGTSSGGVSKYNGASITNFISPADLGLSSVFSITEDKVGNLWLGTIVKGINKYDGQSFTNYGSAQGLGLSGDNVQNILNDKQGNLWLGTNGSGLVGLIENSFTLYTTEQGLVHNGINSIFEDKDGILWISSFNGLSAFNPSGNSAGFTNYTSAQGLAHNAVSSVKQDKYGNLWISTYREGISVFDPKNKMFINFNLAQGLCGKIINHITLDKNGNIWISSNGAGLSRVAAQEVEKLNASFSTKTPYPLKFENLTIANGLPDDVVYDIATDRQGNIFIGTNLGITVIPDSLISKPFDQVRDKMEYYNTPHGYPIKDLNTRALYGDHNGIIWAGTGSEKTGLVRFDYASIHKTNRSPDLVIQNLKINGENIGWSTLQSKGILQNSTDSARARLDESLSFGQMFAPAERSAQFKKFGTIHFDSINKFYSIPHNLTLPNAHNNITIEFNAIETDKPQLVNYQYILEGYDREWSPVQKNTSATFGNISGGTYTFKVKAQGANRVWSEPVTYTFSVMPPWYASWWAYLSYILIACVSVYSFVRWRLKQLKSKHDELEKIIENRTHELKQRADELAVINSVQEGLVREMDMNGIYKLVGDRLCMIFPDSQTLVIRTFDQETGLEYFHYVVENGEHLTITPRPFIWESKQLIRTKKPLDIESNYEEIAIQNGETAVTEGQPVKSAVFVPMLVGEHVKGSISLQNVDHEHAFNESDIRLLLSLSNSMSVALENARLFDETNRLLGESKQRAAELATVNSISKALAAQLDPDDLIQMVGDQLRDLFKANIVYLALLNQKTNVIDFPYQFGEDMPQRKLGEGLTSKVIMSGEPLLINKDLDETTTRMGIQRIGLDSASYLGVPIPVGDKNIGVLSVQSTEHENRFNDNDLRLLSTIASSVGVALTNATLFEEVQQAKSEAEAASKQAEKANEAKSAFLSTVSHELRTPLTSVLGFAKIIKKRLEEKIFPLTDTTDPKTEKAMQQVSDNLNVVVSEGQRLTSLINDVLDLAKIEAGKMQWNEEQVSLEEVAERAIAATTSLFDQKSLILIKDIDKNLPTIIGDKDKLIQVIVNLISNSVKFTPEGAVTCKIVHQDEEVRVTISDTGIGIAPKDHAAVFEQFKQVGDTLTDKPKGTGLGLPICKEIIEHHGGRIWLESDLGQGSKFIFALPIHKNNAARPIHLDALLKQLNDEVSRSQQYVKGVAANILIVDDDDSIRSLLQQELGDAGYLIEEARNGKEALTRVREHRPDLIILDIMMPEMNGFDVAAILKNDPATMDIPIIVLSIVEDKARGFHIGIDRYLNKPIDTHALFNEIGSLLDQGKSKKKVMIVDEDAATVSTLTEVLKAKGYVVIESDGKELLEKALANSPDIMIINSLLSNNKESIKSLQFEKGMEHVLFLVYE